MQCCRSGRVYRVLRRELEYLRCFFPRVRSRGNPGSVGVAPGNGRVPVWDIGEIRLAVGVRHSRRGSDVAYAADGELVSAAGQASVASPSPSAATAATYVLQGAGRWCRHGGDFLLGLAAKDEKSVMDEGGGREAPPIPSYRAAPPDETTSRIACEMGIVVRGVENFRCETQRSFRPTYLFFCRGCTPAAKRLRY